jgi:ADP-heptose:LPS heptosyltransferase
VFAADVNGKHKGIFWLYKLSKELKTSGTSTSLSTGIDAVADLHNVLRSTILKRFFSKIPCVQIDKGRAEKKALISGENFSQLKTTHQRYADVFEALGFPIDLAQPTFPDTIDLSDTLKAITGEKNTKWIGIAPFAAHKSKMYPLVKMLDVIEALSKEYKLFLFGGGDKEIPFLQPIADSYKNVINLAGKLSLDEELDAISNLDVMVSMDSGNAHIAAMLGVKVVTIWGVTHPFAGFAPYNQPDDYALVADRIKYPKIPTSVYGNKYPQDYENAARSILPETIIKKIKSIL